MKMIVVSVYKLTDPRKAVLTFYVGATTNKPKIRLKEHLYDIPRYRKNRKRQWFLELKSKDLRPILTVLDKCSLEESSLAEHDTLLALIAIRGLENCVNKEIRTLRKIQK